MPGPPIITLLSTVLASKLSFMLSLAKIVIITIIATVAQYCITDAVH